MRTLVLAVLVCGAGVARADAPAWPEYPLEYVDRPLLLYRGMSLVDVSEDFTRYIGVIDAMGNTIPKINWGHTLDLAGAMSLGPVEATAQLVGNTAAAGIVVRTSTWSSIAVSLADYAPNRTTDHDYAETLGYTYKLLAAPHKLALYASANVRLAEYAFTPPMDMTRSGLILSAAAGVAAQLQLTRQLAFDIGTSTGIPIASSAVLQLSSHTTFGTYVELVHTFRHWDVYGNVGLSNITHDNFVSASVGFVHRWRI